MPYVAARIGWLSYVRKRRRFYVLHFVVFPLFTTIRSVHVLHISIKWYLKTFDNINILNILSMIQQRRKSRIL